MKRLRGAIPEHIAQRVAGLRAMDTALHRALPAEAARHCRAAGRQGATVRLVADSPAWRARLRFYAQDILREINKLHNSPVRELDIRVGRFEWPVDRYSARPPHPGIPHDAARALEALAADTEDERLRASLRRLAAHRRGG